jgi:outer membrane protein assembly factor BamB
MAVWVTAGFLSLNSPARGTPTPEQRAHEILAETGIQGGLIVHLGCGDGRLTRALRANESLLVHGLDRDPENVARARAMLRAAGHYGPVSVERFAGDILPYTDRLVNLLIVEDRGGVPLSEIRRVLVPQGVAFMKRGDAWEKFVLPRPAEMDEWTHYLHDPSGNAVSQDTLVGFLRQQQWIGGPLYGRHHDHMSSASAMVSAGGRLFYIFDHGSPLSIQLPSQWQLVARDAFNGVVLWRRSIDSWFSQMQRLKSGPSNLPRRLVAVGDTVFVTLALDAPVTALNAASGEVRRTYQGTEGTDEILYADGVLYLVVNRMGHTRTPFTAWTEQPRVIMAVSADTGKVLWEREWAWVVPGCLALDRRRAAFFDGERLVALDRETGDLQWQSKPLGKRSPVPVYFSPCLVFHRDLVLFSGADPETNPYHADNGKTMVALSAQTGERLWQAPHAPSGYRSAEDILVLNDLVWTSDVFNSKEFRTEQTGTVWGRDPQTGEVKVEFKPDVDTHWFHHRCYRAKATENYLLTSRTGIEFVDVRRQHWTCHHWVRGACLYGIMPANGMIYTPPHPCACYLEAKQAGFNALAAHSAIRQTLIDRLQQMDRLERGPAYDKPVAPVRTAPSDWPTLRADAERSGRTATPVPARPVQLWQTRVGGRLSSLVAAYGRLWIAVPDAHEIRALDAVSGKALWHFTAGARIDSPPTLWQGRVLFGSRDGFVYCLRADSGDLIWRYRAAPADLRMGAFGQIESVWPVHGNVLVRENETRDPELWCVAGRSMFLDGGMRLVRLHPATGMLIEETVLDDRVPGTEDNLQTVMQGLNMPVALPDILVDDGDLVYMKSQPFDARGRRTEIDAPTRQAREQKGDTAHLFCPTGMLDDVWWHRSYWIYGRVWKSGAGGYYQSGRFAPAGRPMVFDDQTVYSFGRKPEFYRWTTPMEYMLYATAKQPPIVKTGQNNAGLSAMPPTRIQTGWTRDLPILGRAMVLADQTLFLAGPVDLIDERETLKTLDTAETQRQLAQQAAAFAGAAGARLWSVSAQDGSQLNEQSLDGLPVFDGLIAAANRLYYATTDGRVICLGAKD